MRKIFAGLFLVAIIFLSLCDLTLARSEVLLNGKWEVQFSHNGDKPPVGKWSEFIVPSHLSRQEEKYVWYRKIFAIPKYPEKEHIFLKFGGIKFVSYIYVNGKKVGSHYGGWEPFELEITDSCNMGEENQLLIKVTDMRGVIDQEMDNADRTEGERFIEQAKDSVLAPVGSQPDRFGIWQDVSLEFRSDVYIDDVFIKTSVRDKTIEADFKIVNLSNIGCTNYLFCQVYDGDNVSLELGSMPVDLEPKSAVKITMKKEWHSPKLWSPESPHLYSLISRLSENSNSALMDEMSTRFGFREFWIEGTDFFLNETKINFLATAGHPNYGHTKEDAKVMYRNIRSANCVAMRLHANIWPETWYEAADEVGMLLIQESALWCFPNQYALSRDIFWENMKNHLSSIIKRDKNHPSVVMYSLENEILHCGGNRVPETEKRLAELGKFVKKTDPTRPIMYDGDADPMGVADVENLHYPHEFPKWNLWPNTAYWLNETTVVSGWPKKEWKWERKKPLYMGEFLWIPTQTPDPYTIFVGDEAYTDSRSARAKSKAEAWSMQVEAYRAEGMAGMCPWTLLESGKFPNVQYDSIKRAYEPNAAFIEEYDSRFYSGEIVSRTIHLYNDTFHPAQLKLTWSLRDKDNIVDEGERQFNLSSAERANTEILLHMPQVSERKRLKLLIQVENRKPVFEDEKTYWVFPEWKPKIHDEVRIGVYSGDKESPKYAGLAKYIEIPALTKISSNIQTLIISPNALDSISTSQESLHVAGDESAPGARLAEFVQNGGTVFVMQQSVYPESLLPASLTDHSSTITFRGAPNHDILTGVTDDELKWWRGDHIVSKNDIVKPTGGCFKAIINSGGEDGLTYLPLMEIFSGKGRYILCQLSLNHEYNEPIADIIFENIINYCLKPAEERVRTGIIQHDQEIGRDIESVGAIFDDLSDKLQSISLADYGALIIDGSSAEAVENLHKIREFVKSGGKMLIHSLKPDDLEKLGALFPEEISLSRSTAIPVSIFQQDPAISGLTNHDLYWLGKHVGSWRSTTPLSLEIIDYAITKGLPEHEGCYGIEAEKMAAGYGNPRFAAEIVNMYTNGSIATEIEFPKSAEYIFGVRASGTPHHGAYAQVGLLVDGLRKASFTLDKGEWDTYTVVAQIDAGMHEIALEFANDRYDQVTKEDRNLSLDKMIYAESPPAKLKRLLMPAALVKVPLGEGYYLIDQINWHGRTASQDKAARYLTNLLVNLGVSFRKETGFLSISGANMEPAEDLRLYSTSGAIMRLGTNGYIYSDIKFASSREYIFEISARGTEAGGEYPNIRLSIDGKVIGDQMLGYAGWQTLTFKAYVGSDTHRVNLEFTNDYWEPPEDRNLEIRQLRIK